jgi:hypothetical protein
VPVANLDVNSDRWHSCDVPAQPTRIALSSHGVRVQVEVVDQRLLAEVHRILPPGAVALDWDDAAPGFLLTADPEAPPARLGVSQVVTGATDAIALDVLDSLIRQQVSVAAADHVFVHAGTVIWRDRAIVVPGRSRAGKSTLVAALLRAGADYASDEFAVLDEQGLVWPYPRRISIRDSSIHGTTEVEVEAYGARCAAGPKQLGLVLVTQFVAGCTWQPARLTAAAGVSALMANTPVARAAPARVLRVLTRAVAAATVLHGVRGEAAPTAEAVLRTASATW